MIFFVQRLVHNLAMYTSGIGIHQYIKELKPHVICPIISHTPLNFHCNLKYIYTQSLNFPSKKRKITTNIRMSISIITFILIGVGGEEKEI